MDYYYARLCTATNQGINEGYVVEDGEAYFLYKEDLANYLRKKLEGETIPNLLKEEEEWLSVEAATDDELIEYCYEIDVCYWTAWYDDYQYVERNGFITEI